jgi:hypothetical protein
MGYEQISTLSDQDSSTYSVTEISVREIEYDDNFTVSFLSVLNFVTYFIPSRYPKFFIKLNLYPTAMEHGQLLTLNMEYISYVMVCRAAP